jgi:hypothetical protein
MEGDQPTREEGGAFVGRDARGRNNAGLFAR